MGGGMIVATLLAALVGAGATPQKCTTDLECTMDKLCINAVCLLPSANETSDFYERAHAQDAGCLGGSTYSGVLSREITREEFLGFFIACIVVLMTLITAWELLVATRPLGQVVPVAAFSLILGMVFGYAMRVLDLEGPEKQVAAFSNSFFLFVLLPPIIYESAFMMDRKTFFHNIGTILVVVIPGVLLSTATIGMCTYWAGQAGWFTHNGMDPLDFSTPLHPFLFGALISATDPVATLAILSTVNISPVLFALIFGESMLNDAVSIVVYEVLKWYGQDAFTLRAVPIVARDFVGIAIGSVAAGLGVGLASSALHRRMMAHTHHSPSGEMAFLVLFGYFSYVLAEVSELSGITALLVCGIVQRYYAFYSISHEAQHAKHHVLKLIASKSEQFVFLYLGINVFLVSGRPPTSAASRREWGVDLLAFAGFEVMLVTVSRLLMVLVLCAIANLRRQGHPISLAEQFLMWWAGLRGAMAFALAKDLENEMIVSLTITVVLFTTFVQGCSTAFVVKRLGLIVPSSRHTVPNAMLRQASHKAVEAGGAPPLAAPEGASSKVTSGASITKKRQQRWDEFDMKYMRPYFGGPGLSRPKARPLVSRGTSPNLPRQLGQQVVSSGSMQLSQYSHDSQMSTAERTGCILDLDEEEEHDASGGDGQAAASGGADVPNAADEAGEAHARDVASVWREASNDGVIDSSGGVNFWRLSASTLPGRSAMH